MNIQSIYEQAYHLGIQADPRGQAGVTRYLKQVKQQQQDSPAYTADFLDHTLCQNPYADTRILYGNPAQPVQTVWAGIDIGVEELLLVDRLKAKGNSIDLLIAHHPEGIALTQLSDVMALQADVFGGCGIPINVAEKLLEKEIEKTAHGLIVGNYNRVVDAARWLELPLLCVHTPADNLVQQFIEKCIHSQELHTVEDVMQRLLTLPEYQAAAKAGAGPRILAGSPHHRLGKIMIDMTGGSDAGPDVYSQLGPAGIGTVIAMHMSEGVSDKLAALHINVILAGHMSSDSLGMNLFLDTLQQQGINTLCGSGLTRFCRLPDH